MTRMKLNSRVKIMDITEKVEYERYLYRCLAPMPFRRYVARQKYYKKQFQKDSVKTLNC